MPMLLGAKGKDILQWRPCAELVTSFREALVRRWDRTSAAEARSLLEGLRERLEDELSYEENLALEMSGLDDGIREASSLEGIKPLLSRYHELIAAHFSRRHAVLALFDISNRLHDATCAKAVALAAGRMLEFGQGAPPPFALLVSGARARGEQTIRNQNRYLILHEKQSPGFPLFKRQLASALKETGLLESEQLLWHGSLSDLRSAMAAGFSPGQSRNQPTATTPLPSPPPPKGRSQELPEWEYHVETMADLMQLSGDQALARDAIATAATMLAEIRQHPPFQQLASRVIALPLAVGRFGRWRLVREGEHQGEIDLEENALAPLVMTVRILAISFGVAAGGTLQRIEALLEKGVLPVELADRLLKAFRCFCQIRIMGEIRSAAEGGFCNLDELDEPELERFRSSVETVLNLQKIAYQRMIGQV